MATAQWGAQVWRRSSPTSDRSVPRRSSTRCSRGSGERHVAPRPNWAHPCHICTGTGLTPARSAPGLNSPLPHLHRDWAHSPATSAPGLGSPLPALLRDWTCPCHICTAALWGRGRASRPTLRCSQLRIACMARHRCSSAPPSGLDSLPAGRAAHCRARRAIGPPSAHRAAYLRGWHCDQRTALVLHTTAAHGCPRAAAVACATRRGRAAVQGTLAGLG